MTFRDVNPKKLAFLLTQGTHESELRKFFLDSRTQLILKGARVQNLPHGRGERIREICERFPQKTDEIFRAWFHKNITLSDPTPLPDVVAYLELLDAGDLTPDSDARLVSRSALVYLCADVADEGLLAFLRRAPGTPDASSQEHHAGVEDTDSDTRASKEDVELKAVEIGAPPQKFQVAELLASIVSADESALDNALVPFPEDTRAFVEALILIRDGDIDAATEQLGLLEEDSPESALVHKALNRARHQGGAPQAPSGIRVVIPQPLSEHPETTSHEIVGIFTNGSESGAIFVQPFFLVLGGRLHSLSYEDRIKLFPESGDVMSHRLAIRRPLERGEIVRWKVVEHGNSGGRTHFRLDSELASLMEVIRLTVPSSDPDEVRDQSKSLAAERQLSGHQAVFLLSDGVAVASPKTGDITRDEAFERPWQAWSSLETWLIEGRQFCLDASPGSGSPIDLSPLEATFKKLIRDLETEQRSPLNKTQKRELADSIRSRTAGEAALRAKRVAAFLDQIALDSEELDSVLSMLKAREDVQRRIEELVAKGVEERNAERSSLTIEIESLKRKKEDLAKEGRELERNNRKRAESVAASVKEAFSKAINDGVATFATTEIFRTLSGSVANTPPEMREVSLSNPVESRMNPGSLTLGQVRARLCTLGLNGRQAAALSLLSSLVTRSGIGLFLKGNGARQYIQVLVRLDSETSGTIEIPMGLTSSAPVRRALENVANASALAIVDADLSPFDAYGAQLLDSLFESAIEDQESRDRILFSCLGSDISLPLPAIVQRVAITIDLESQWDQGLRTIDEIEEEGIPLLKPLREKLFRGLTQLEAADQELVKRVLAKAFTLDA